MNRKIGVILSYVLMVFEVASTLLVTPLILRTLGQAEYGIYRLSGTIVTYLLLLDLGIGNAQIRFLSKYRANNDTLQLRKFFGVSILYYAAIALLALLIGIGLVIVYPTVFAKGLTANEIILGQKLLVVTLLTTFVTLLTSPFANVLIAFERFSASRGSAIISTAIKIVITFIALKLGFGSVGLVVINLVITLASRFFYVVYVFLKLKLKPLLKNIKGAFIKEIIVYSSFILLQMIATQINSSMGQILLGSLVSSSAVIIAVYSVGTQIVQYYQSIGSSITGVLMPGIVKLIEDKPQPKKICDEMIRIGRLILIVLLLILIGFILCGKQFILLWAGNENIDAYGVAVILLFAYMMVLTQSVGGQFLWAMNAHKEQSILKLIIVVLNVFVTLFLMKLNALYGIVLGTFASLIIGDVILMNIIFKQKIGISLSQYYKGLFKGFIPCAIITLVVGSFFQLLKLSGWIGLICNILFVIIVYSASLFLFGMNDYERNLLRDMLNKMFRVVVKKGKGVR